MKIIEDLFDDIEKEVDLIINMQLSDDYHWIHYGVPGVISKYIGNTIYISGLTGVIKQYFKSDLWMEVIIDCNMLPKFAKTITSDNQYRNFLFIHQQNLRRPINIDLKDENIVFLDDNSEKDLGLVVNANVKGNYISIRDAKKSTFKCDTLCLGSIFYRQRPQSACLDGCNVDARVISIFIDNDLKSRLYKLINEENPEFSQFITKFSKCKLSKRVQAFEFIWTTGYSEQRIVVSNPDNYRLAMSSRKSKQLKDKPDWFVFYSEM